MFKKFASGRATCKKCGTKIEKGETDIGYKSIAGPRSEERHYHLKCLLNMPIQEK